MDTKFQTSFIPRKPIGAGSSVGGEGSSTGLFMLFAIIVFLLSIGGAGLAYVIDGRTLATERQYQDTLKANENEFNPTLIGTLQRVNTKIDLVKGLLQNHLAPDAVFNIIARLVAQNVSFSSLDYSAPTESNNQITLSMSGMGTGFSAIAFQSDVFGQSVQYGLNIALKNPVLAGLGGSPTGNVTFTFTAGLDPSTILYSKVLASSLSGASQ